MINIKSIRNTNTTTFQTAIQNSLPGIFLNPTATSNAAFLSMISTNTFARQLDLYILTRGTFNNTAATTGNTIFHRGTNTNNSAPFLLGNAPGGGNQYNVNGQSATGPVIYNSNTWLLNVNLFQSTQATSLMTGFSNGNQMCQYGNGTVLNIGVGICPLSIQG